MKIRTVKLLYKLGFSVVINDGKIVGLERA